MRSRRRRVSDFQSRNETLADSPVDDPDGRKRLDWYVIKTLFPESGSSFDVQTHQSHAFLSHTTKQHSQKRYGSLCVEVDFYGG